MPGRALPVVLWCCLAGMATARAAERQIVASIGPVHSLVAAVMKGVGSPILLVRGNASPHGHTLRPRSVAAVADAQVLFWVGPDFEVFLTRLLDAHSGVRSVPLIDAPGMRLLSIRESGIREQHDDHVGHGRDDPHIWLDPLNAQAMVTHIAQVLSEEDPENAESYGIQADLMVQRLASLTKQLETRLAPLRQVPFLVFHDGYRYFEQRFGLASLGSVVVDAEHLPGARRVTELRDRVTNHGVVCVFSEPQFAPALAQALTSDSEARVGSLDAIGVDLEPGPEAYVQLLENLAASFENCLAP